MRPRAVLSSAANAGNKTARNVVLMKTDCLNKPSVQVFSQVPSAYPAIYGIQREIKKKEIKICTHM